MQLCRCTVATSLWLYHKFIKRHYSGIILLYFPNQQWSNTVAIQWSNAVAQRSKMVKSCGKQSNQISYRVSFLPERLWKSAKVVAVSMTPTDSERFLNLIKSERLFSLIDSYCILPSPNESNLLLLKFSIYFVNFEQLRQVSWSFAQLSTKSPSCACGCALAHVLPRQRISTWDDFMALSSLQIKPSQSISRRVNFLIPDY